MLDWVIQTIAAWGYLGIFLLMLLENLVPPIPSELIMPLAGFAAVQGKLNAFGVVLAGTAGSVIGALPWYFLGKRVGEKRLRQWLTRYGRWVALSVEDLERSQRWFSRYGGALVFLGRLIPGIRTYVSIPAGLEGMPMLPFLLFSTLGTVVWVSLLTAMGYLLGQNYDKVEQFISPIGSVVPILVLGGILLWLLNRWYRQSRPS